MERENDTEGDASTPRPITVNQVVAWNIGWLRRIAGLTQRQLGERLGWTNVAVSEAERSFDGRRLREFSADELARLALALGVPLAALFLPPADGAVYRFAGTDGEAAGMGALLRLVLPDNDDEGPVMDAYRARFNAAAAAFFASEPEWARLVARWVGGSGQQRIERAARLRRRRDELLAAATAASEALTELADAFDLEGSGV